jgi:integrase
MYGLPTKCKKNWVRREQSGKSLHSSDHGIDFWVDGVVALPRRLPRAAQKRIPFLRVRIGKSWILNFSHGCGSSGQAETWVFSSRNGTPVNPNNARSRYLKPAAKALGISLCGWHDFRRSLTTELRRKGVHPKVVSDLLGHKKVDLAMNVYDRSTSATSSRLWVRS